MDDGDDPPVEWSDLAGATPGCLGIQSADEFVYVSEEFAASFGVPAETLVGESWRTLFDATGADGPVREAIRAARVDGRWEGTVRPRGTAGDDSPIEVTVSATGSGALVWLAADPASLDGRFARADARGSRPSARHGLLRTVLDVVDDAVYVVAERGRTHLWTEAFVGTTGYSHEELDGMRPAELVPGTQRERVPGLVEPEDAPGDRRVEVDIRTEHGELVPHEFRGVTLTDPETGERFRCGLALDVTERRERQRDVERYRTIVETVDDGVYALDEDLRFSFVNEGLCDMVGLPPEELVGTAATDLFVSDDESRIAERVRERVVEGDTGTGTIRATLPTSDGERSLESRYRLHPEPDGEYRGSIGIIRDVTEREERERELERQRDELATLNRITELLLETIRELIATASREAIERTICERLTASDRYRFAWVGERAFDRDRIVPRTTAGEDGGYLDAVTVTAGRDEASTGPAGRAIRTGEVRVTDTDDPTFEPYRDAAVERGFESVAAVPLHHRGTVHGVLVVYATREGAFSEREQAGFDVLGRTVGLAVDAAGNRELLFADRVVELEFDVTGVDSAFVHAATEHDCELVLDGYVASGDRWLLYVTVDGASLARVAESTADDPRIEGARVVGEGDAGGRIELVVAESSLLHAVNVAGSTVRTAVATPDDAHLVVEVPADADVRGIVNRVLTAYPRSELAARRERDHEATTVGRPDGVIDRLTDRQREALETAHRAGYFAWPRESTGEEIAESLNVAAPTLHAHLRKAEARILSALLD